MDMDRNNEEYWSKSSIGGFEFDDDKDSLHPPDDCDISSPVTDQSIVIPLHTLISETNLDLILDEISSTLEYISYPIEETVKKALIGHKYSLEMYKTFTDKINLLDAAVETHHGNFMLNVILFCKSTLKTNIFHQQLFKRKLALKIYAYHLIVNNQFEELTDLYMATGNIKNLKQIFYFIGKCMNNKQLLYKKLKQFSSENLQTIDNCDEKAEVQDYLHFIDWQVERNQTAGNVIEQLAVLSQNEWQKNPNSMDAVITFKKLLRIDEMAFEWTIMNVMAAMQLWPQLISHFIKPNWFNKKKVLETTISQEIFVYGVSRHKPPKEVLEQLLNYMTDTEKSLSMAQKLNCHKFIIQNYINQKDRLALIAYKAKLMAQDEAYFLIENALHSSDKKWKN